MNSSTNVIEGLKRKYNNIHPLLFQRSVEYAETPGELFDILNSIPEFPIVWDAESRSWKHITDIGCSEKLSLILGE